MVLATPQDDTKPNLFLDSKSSTLGLLNEVSVDSGFFREDGESSQNILLFGIKCPPEWCVHAKNQ